MYEFLNKNFNYKIQNCCKKDSILRHYNVKGILFDNKSYKIFNNAITRGTNIFQRNQRILISSGSQKHCC